MGDGTHSLPQSRRAVMWRFTSFIRSWVRWPTSTCRRRSRISFMMCHSRWKRSPSFLWEGPKHGSSGQSPEWAGEGKGRTSPAQPPCACHSVGRFSVNGSLSPHTQIHPLRSTLSARCTARCCPRIQLPFPGVLTTPPCPEPARTAPPPPPILLSLAPSTFCCPSRLYPNPPLSGTFRDNSYPHSFLSSLNSGCIQWSLLQQKTTVFLLFLTCWSSCFTVFPITSWLYTENSQTHSLLLSGHYSDFYEQTLFSFLLVKYSCRFNTTWEFRQARRLNIRWVKLQLQMLLLLLICFKALVSEFCHLWNRQSYLPVQLFCGLEIMLVKRGQHSDKEHRLGSLTVQSTFQVCHLLADKPLAIY